MPILKNTGRFLTVAALAASTTLSGPSFAYAQQKAAVRLAQAEPEQAPADAEAVPKPRKARPAAEPESAAAPEVEAPPRKAKPERAAEPEAEEAEAPARALRKERKAAEPAALDEPESEAPAKPKRGPKASAAEPTAGEEAAGETPARPKREPKTPVAAEPASAEEPAADAPAKPKRESKPAQPDAAEPNAEAPAKPKREPKAPTAEQSATEAPSKPKPTTEPTDAAAVPVAPAADAPATPQTGKPARPAKPTRPAASDAGAPEPSAASEAPDIAAPEAGKPGRPAKPDSPATPGDAASPPEPGAPAPDAAAGGRPVPPGAAEPKATVPGAAVPPGAEDTTAESGAPARPRRSERPKPVPVDVQTAPVKQGEIDQSDARVQTLDRPVVEQPITSERGERLKEAPRYEQPPEGKVVKRVGDRDIISIVGAAAAGAAVGAAAGYFIRSNDDDRLAVDSREQYQERLPRGRTRDTIVRPNGSQVVTITNEYGDVVQRSRIDPDGREVVLFSDPYSEDERPRPDYYDDPGEDLPPLELSIPRDRYIVDTDQPDEELYFDTMVAPPVETVDRIYSVDEVRRSERIRDKVRRIDVNTSTFDFGSATISQAEVKNLQALADAISRVIKDNPGETFLIEGHTDAVGSNVANLALSDQRAESVAAALSQYFEIPSENLITQGYGEEDLKVDTQSENRDNRRVTIRRITALVKPVTTAAQ